MKIKYLAFLLLFIGLQSANAQFELGVKTGLNISKPLNEQNGIEIDQNKIAMRFQIGVYSRYKFNDKYSINPEMLIQNKGLTIEGSYVDTKIYDTYLSLPVLFGFQPDKNFTILFGPEFSYLFSSRYKNPITDINQNYRYRNKYDLGISIGARQVFLQQFFADLRYTHGFMDIHSEKEYVVKNRVLQFSLGYRLK